MSRKFRSSEIPGMRFIDLLRSSESDSKMSTKVVIDEDGFQMVKSKTKSPVQSEKREPMTDKEIKLVSEYRCFGVKMENVEWYLSVIDKYKHLGITTIHEVNNYFKWPGPHPLHYSEEDDPHSYIGEFKLPDLIKSVQSVRCDMKTGVCGCVPNSAQYFSTGRKKRDGKLEHVAEVRRRVCSKRVECTGCGGFLCVCADLTPEKLNPRQRFVLYTQNK